MSEQPATAPVPKWDTADRMRKSLRVAGMSPGEMAQYLQVGGNTVSTWINGRIDPSAQTLRLWALRTGVPFTWLCHGDLNPCDLRPRGETRASDLRKLPHGRRATYMHMLQAAA